MLKVGFKNTKIVKMMDHFRVLTLWQPWATLLVYGIKGLETRPKKTSWMNDKGSYLIHAASRWTKAQKELCFKEPFLSALIVIAEEIGFEFNPEIDKFENIIKLPLGQIIGSVEIADCKQILTYSHYPFRGEPFYWTGAKSLKIINGKEKSFGDYTSGRYAWLCENPKQLINPIPYKGGRGYYQKFHGDESQLIFK
jgi:hypothetical protein